MTKSAGAQLRDISKLAMDKQEKVVSSSMMRLGQRIVTSSPVLDGFLINNWMSAYESIDKTANMPADKNGTGSITRLKTAVSDVKLGKTFYFTNSKPYAYGIEYLGKSERARYGMIRINAMDFDKIVDEQVRFYSK